MSDGPRGSSGWVLCADILGFKTKMTGEMSSIEKRVEQLITLWADISANSLSGDNLLVSDSVFVHWPCSTDGTEEVSRQFEQARSEVRGVLDRFCDCDFILRGAMMYGDIVVSPSMWAGPALFSAHTIESSVINEPLVVVPEKECRRVSENALSGVPCRDLTTKDGGILRCRIILPRKVKKFKTHLLEEQRILSVNGPSDGARKINNALDTIDGN